MFCLCITITSTPAKIFINKTGFGQAKISVAKGRATAAHIEPSETFLLSPAVRKNTQAITANTGSPVNNPRAAATDTPFPPLKPKYIGKQWPIMQAAPAAAFPASPQRYAPISIAIAVLAASHRSVASPAFSPNTRATFVAPAFPLPSVLTSLPYAFFEIGIEAQKEPRRYPNTTITIYFNSITYQFKYLKLLYQIFEVMQYANYTTFSLHFVQCCIFYVFPFV